MAGLSVGSKPCSCGRHFHDPQLVAVTGGPGAGKTAILELALRSFCNHVGVIPEAAGVLFGGGFPRDDDAASLRFIQRAIFHVQEQMEGLVLEMGRVAVALCDRGTLDGLAYWPGAREEFWSDVGSAREAQLARYTAVLHLRTPAVTQGYNHDNALRVESAAEAREIDERILRAWDGHPHRVVIESTDDFLKKAQAALEYVRDQLPECCRGHQLTSV